ncbi:MAG: hypothetical protein ACSHYA_20190 [Opitutaceae bacterium]
MEDLTIDTPKMEWGVADAKSHISEIMRNARQYGPQRIGSQKPCVLVSEEEWLRLNGQKAKLGDWLLERLTGVGEIELPSRIDPPREIPFSEEV